MGTRVLAITLRPQLITLVTGPADSPPYGTSRASGPSSWAVRVLAVLLLRTLPGKVWVMDPYVLLELL